MAKLTAQERALLNRLLQDEDGDEIEEAEEDGEIEEVEPGEEVDSDDTVITLNGKRYKLVVEDEPETPKAKTPVKKPAPIKKAVAPKKVVRKPAPVVEEEVEEEETEGVAEDPAPLGTRRRFLS